MNLLALLHELESDAGWQAYKPRYAADHGWARSGRVCCGFSRPSNRSWSALVYIPNQNRRVLTVANDPRTALKMALAGYRAGETR